MHGKGLRYQLYNDGEKVQVRVEVEYLKQYISLCKLRATKRLQLQVHFDEMESHRLASTRFCDRILLLDSGVIREEGTHDSLMKARGKYYEMFQVQSQYYKDTGATDELAERTVKEGAV